jgi:hypothetical protein
MVELLCCSDTIWDINALRVLDGTTVPITNLPLNLQPTTIQQRVPHHPLFDILPWPTVRNNCIILFAQPPKARPPVARDPMALMQFSYDLEDPGDGLRINGADWKDEKNWEIGQLFFKNWWFVLDRNVVAQSNASRRMRGAEKLLLPTT